MREKIWYFWHFYLSPTLRFVRFDGLEAADLRIERLEYFDRKGKL